ncbi:hypothetical protein EDC01DRAFT_720151 [Geopyxis carbonaria]|nr:hypothetical protein EDC01DRAFT_720151 [Geopyxis carbonaria]
MDTTPATPLATEINPYEILGIEKSATGLEIRSAYKKRALAVHPDKVHPDNRSNASQQFQLVALAYAILSDENRRKKYDQTGSTLETLSDDCDFDWGSFFREKYNEIDEKAIAKFKTEYQGTEEEKQAVLDIYVSSGGSLDEIFEQIMLSNPTDDEDRFREIINTAIQDGRVEAYDSFIRESSASKRKRKKVAAKESSEAMEYAKELGVYEKIFGSRQDDDDTKDDRKRSHNAGNGTRAKRRQKSDEEASLQAIIKARGSNTMDTLIQTLEAKYTTKAHEKTRGSKRGHKEPTEEEFQKARTNLQEHKDGRPHSKRHRKL